MQLQAEVAEVVRRCEAALEAEQQACSLLPHIRVRERPHGTEGVCVEKVEKRCAREGEGQPVRHGHVPGELKDGIAGQVRGSRTRRVIPGSPELRRQPPRKA